MMRAMVYDKAGGLRLEERAVPKLSRGDALLRMIACGVCGTDLLKINQQLVAVPTVLGHELVGEIVEVGEGCRFQCGDKLVVAHHVPCFRCHYCLRGATSMCRKFKNTQLDPGGFADFVRVSAEHLQHVACKIPDTLSLDEALFVEPLGCCVRNLARLNVQTGDGVVIVGLGSIGLMMALLFQAHGIQVIATDLKPERVALAKKLGVKGAALSADWSDELMQDFPEKRADCVVFTAGGWGLVGEALPWLRAGGTLNLFCALPQNGAGPDPAVLYHHELNIVTTYSSSPQALAQAFDLLVQKKIQLAPLITHRYKLPELKQAVADLNNLVALKAVILP